MLDLNCKDDEKQANVQELRSHLATLLRLENVGFFLGAGCSITAGGKSLKQLWDVFSSKTDDISVLENHLSIFPWDDVDVDVEALVAELSLLQSAVKKFQDIVNSDDVSKLLSLKDALENKVLEAANLSLTEDCLKSHIALLHKLVGTRQPGQSSPWVFTTNYDLAVERAAEYAGILVNTGFTGIHNRIFSPQAFDLGYRNIYAEGEARFGCNDIYLVKLHGSLSWVQSEGNDVREVQLLDAQNNNDPLIIYPNKTKYVDTLGYVYSELFRRFADFLAKPQTCLIVSGYSFRDEHVNRLIFSALLNPTFQLVIFTTELEGEKISPALSRLINLNSPRVTVIGSGSEVYFDKVVSYMPEAILFDAKRMMLAREIREWVSSNPGTNVQNSEGRE